MFGCQQIRIDPDPLEREIWVFICQQANKLANCGTYLLRQAFFAFNQVEDNAFALHAELKDNPHFKILRSAAAQQVLTGVTESFTSFNELLHDFFAGKEATRPKLPGYRTKNGLATISYPARWVKFDLETGYAYLSLGKEFNALYGIDHLRIPPPHGLRVEDISEIRILPRNGAFYAEYVYSVVEQQADVDYGQALGLDHGVNNWLTGVSTAGTSFIIDGRKVKSLNTNYNRLVSKRKAGKDQDYWDDYLASLTEKRNRQMRDGINKAARMVIDYCIENRIGTVVFGWNPRNKDSINIGRKNNQEFVQIPTARLKKRIEQLCRQYGLNYLDTEESYTSKTSFLDRDFLPTHGERPESWKPSGKRSKRGLYISGEGVAINADCNGAANILRKVEIQLGLDLAKVSKAVLTQPARLYVWYTGRKKRKNVVLTRSEASSLNPRVSNPQE